MFVKRRRGLKASSSLVATWARRAAVVRGPSADLLLERCLCRAEPDQDLGGGGGGALVSDHVVYVAADEHRLVCPGEVDASEPRAAQQRGHPAGVGKGESSRRPGLLAVAEHRRGLGEPRGEDRVLLAGAPAQEG